jgi:hypothetical protein
VFCLYLLSLGLVGAFDRCREEPLQTFSALRGFVFRGCIHSQGVPKSESTLLGPFSGSSIRTGLEPYPMIFEGLKGKNEAASHFDVPAKKIKITKRTYILLLGSCQLFADFRFSLGVF